MSDDEKNIMIGDLLVRSGLISSGDLTEAMAVSRRLGMPMGRVLTMDGRISPDIFQLALEAQSIIRDGLVPPDVGIEALAVAARDRQPIHEALKRMDRHPQAKGSTNRLGELLVDADIISTDQLNAALKASVETGLPLGGTLVTQGIIHASLLPTVLRAQEQIRDGILPRDAAIEELKAAMKIWSKAEAAMKRTDYATEQPLKPSSVMSTLRDTLEGPRPQPQHQQLHHQQQHQQHQQQPHPHPYQQQPPQQVPVHAPPQHQPSQLHAQLQQQYFQDQQQHHQQPQGHPMQHQQTQPMQMPPQMQQPMPQQMQQPMPPQMQQPMPPQMQQPMPQQMQQPMPPQMQQPMPQQMPAPIYGYNTPYGHAPYGGPAPDDPWGSWHGSVPRHHGLGVPLPGFPQPPSMPPEGYAPPPGYPQQMPPQGAPPPPNWNMPAQNAPMPPQQMPQQASNLHAQLQQQQQMQHQHQTPPQQPVHQQHAAPVPHHSAPPSSSTPQAQHQHQAETVHNAVSAAQEFPSSQAPVSASSAPAATVPPPTSPTPAPPAAPPLPASQPVPALEPVRAEDVSKDPGQLKNAAAQLASRLGWAAPKGGDAAADLPSPRKLSWGQPQITSLDSEADTARQEPASQQKSEPVPLVPSRPEAAPLSTSATSRPSSEMRNPFGAPSGSPAGSSTPGGSLPVSKGPESQPEQSNPAFASPPVSETPSTASPAAPSHDFQPSQREEAEMPPEKELLDLAKDAEEEDDDDEPNFKMEFDLELPAPFNKPVEQLRNDADETSEKSEKTEQLETESKSEAKVETRVDAEANAEAEAKSELEPEKVQDKVEEAPTEEQTVPAQAPAPVAEAPATKSIQKPVGLPISMPISMPIETGRPGHIAGFGKGTKISLKSDYAPSDTGRLFAITPSEALTLLAEDDSDSADDKKEAAPAKGKKGKSKASQSQNKLSKQPAKGKKGQAGKSQTGLQSIKEAEAMPSWTTQKNQAHPATMFGKKGGAGVPDFIEDLVPAAQAGLDASAQIGELMPVGPGGKASNTQSKMASIKQRAVSVSVSNLLPVPLEIAEAQAELAYIVEHRGAPATPVTYTPPPPLPPQPQADATIVELLTMSGFFSKKDIASALEKALEDASMAPDLLMALGLVNDDTLDVVVRCQGLTRSRYLTNEQAIYVLGAVRSGRLSFEEALVEIGK